MDSHQMDASGRGAARINGKLSPLQHPSVKHPNSVSMRVPNQNRAPLMGPNQGGRIQSRPIDDQTLNSRLR